MTCVLLHTELLGIAAASCSRGHGGGAVSLNWLWRVGKPGCNIDTYSSIDTYLNTIQNFCLCCSFLSIFLKFQRTSLFTIM